jgi:hypothetical protein
LKAAAEENIITRLVTEVVFQPPMGWLKDDALENLRW